MNEADHSVYCLDHGLSHIQKKRNLKNCKLSYRYSEVSAGSFYVACMNAHTHTHTNILTYWLTDWLTYLLTYTHTHTHTQMHAHTHIHTHRDIQTHIHMHAHAYTRWYNALNILIYGCVVSSPLGYCGIPYINNCRDKLVNVWHGPIGLWGHVDQSCFWARCYVRM